MLINVPHHYPHPSTWHSPPGPYPALFNGEISGSLSNFFYSPSCPILLYSPHSPHSDCFWLPCIPLPFLLLPSVPLYLLHHSLTCSLIHLFNYSYNDILQFHFVYIVLFPSFCLLGGRRHCEGSSKCPIILSTFKDYHRDYSYYSGQFYLNCEDERLIL